jgi:hypothetical protein
LLVYTPTFGDGLLGECRESVLTQQYGDWKWIIDDDDPFPAPDYRNVLAKYRRARALTLSGDYDALVTVEHDMVLPVDALARLAATDAPVVFGVYALRHGAFVLNACRYENDRNVGMSLSFYASELRMLRRAGVGRVSGVGWGCTLVRREVLEQTPLDDGGGQCAAGDLPFAQWCLANHVVMLARFDVACGHATGGSVLMPNEATETVTVTALQSLNVLAGGVSLAIVAGEQYALPIGDALELQRAGYVRQVAEIETAMMDDAPGVEHAVTRKGKRK